MELERKITVDRFGSSEGMAKLSPFEPLKESWNRNNITSAPKSWCRWRIFMDFDGFSVSTLQDCNFHWQRFVTSVSWNLCPIKATGEALVTRRCPSHWGTLSATQNSNTRRASENLICKALLESIVYSQVSGSISSLQSIWMSRGLHRFWTSRLSRDILLRHLVCHSYIIYHCV